MRARWILLAPLLLALTSAAFAQQWFSLQTIHLISYSSDGREREAREAAQRSEQLIAVFGEIFHRKEISFSPHCGCWLQHATSRRRGAGSHALAQTL